MKQGMVSNLFDIEFNKSFISGVFSTIAASFIIYIISKLCKSIYIKIKERKNKYLFVWTPKEPLRNKKDVTKNINEYPKDYKLDFAKSCFVFEDGKMIMVSGLESFKMHLIRFMNTEKDKYKIYDNTSYGVSFLLISNSIEDFNIKASTISGELLAFYSDWIKEIYGLKMHKTKNKIEIMLSVKGINDILSIDVDIRNIA